MTATPKPEIPEGEFHAIAGDDVDLTYDFPVTPAMLRKEAGPWSFEQDRLWKITGVDGLGLPFVAAITEYNQEVTGVTPRLREIVNYGGNAYWFLWTECPKRGWQVEPVGDRK